MAHGELEEKCMVAHDDMLNKIRIVDSYTNYPTQSPCPGCDPNLAPFAEIQAPSWWPQRWKTQLAKRRRLDWIGTHGWWAGGKRLCEILLDHGYIPSHNWLLSRDPLLLRKVVHHIFGHLIRQGYINQTWFLFGKNMLVPMIQSHTPASCVFPGAILRPAKAAAAATPCSKLSQLQPWVGNEETLESVDMANDYWATCYLFWKWLIYHHGESLLKHGQTEKCRMCKDPTAQVRPNYSDFWSRLVLFCSQVRPRAQFRG